MVLARRLTIALAFNFFAIFTIGNARPVNVSSVWLLPEEGYPVFYRYFRDRITWYEAEAVCQFHHGELLTLDSGNELDAAKAYLKELDVTQFVWTGLRKSGPESTFLWPENKPLTTEGNWLQEIPKTSSPLCVAVDPASDYRWTPLPCSGPQAAAFICQMEVPKWAVKGCLVTSLPSLTITFLPEQGAVELVSDCGFQGTKRIACKGNANREDIIKKLSCERSTVTEATVQNSSKDGSWEDQPTRHRRESHVTPDMEHTHPTTTQPNIPPEESAITVAIESSTVETSSLGNKGKEVPVLTTPKEIEMATEHQQITTKEVKIPVPDSEAIMLKEVISQVNKEIVTDARDGEPSDVRKTRLPNKEKSFEVQKNIVPTKKPVALIKEKDHQAAVKDKIKVDKKTSGQIVVAVPLDGKSALVPEGHAPKRTVLLSSKPIPPSLGGNSPFLEKVVENVTEEETEKNHEAPTEESPEVKSDQAYTPGMVIDTTEDFGNGTVSEMPLNDQQDLPERPNRGRLLVRPQHHTFYPYFLNRVLG